MLRPAAVFVAQPWQHVVWCSGDVGVAEVSSLLRPRTCPLQELILHDCGMGEPGTLKLAKRVKASQLRILDIRYAVWDVATPGHV